MDATPPTPDHTTPAAPTPAAPPRRSAIVTAIRAAVGIGLAVLLVHLTLRHTGTNLWGTLYTAHWSLLVAATLAYGAALGLTMYRWNLLLRVQGAFLPAWDIIRLTMIGVFFSMVIPGAVGGDLVKMAYVAKRVPDRKAEVILTIVVDRVLGTLGLFTIASALVLSYLGFLLEVGARDRLVQMAAFTVGAGSLGGILLVLAIELRGSLMRHPTVARLVAWGARRLPARLVAVLERLTTALELYRSQRRTVLTGLGLSLVVHSLIGAALLAIGTALGEQRLRPGDYFLTTQVANAVASIPITPAGIGARDGTIARFFECFGSEPASLRGAIPVTLTLVILFWSLVGAAVFAFSKDHPAPPPAATGPAPQVTAG